MKKELLKPMINRKERSMNVMMKGLLGAAFFTLHSSLFTSCSPETENVFGEQAALRLQKAIASYSATLESAPQGWAMDFYPGELTDGGIAYTAVFKDGRVTLSCERPIDYSELVPKSEYVYAAGQEVTSSYTVKSENSIVLSFDTFNALIHYWAQPYGLKADGYASDYEFTFLSCTDSEVLLRGKKHNNLLRLRPLTQTPATYITQVIATRSSLADIPRKRALVGNQVMNIECMNNHLKYIADGKKQDVPFTYTNYGLRFYEPVVLDGYSCEEMIYDTNSHELRSADGHIVMLAPTTTERFVATTKQWYFNYSKTSGLYDMCDEMVSVARTMVANINSDYYEVVNDFYIGANLQDVAKDPHRLVIGWMTRLNYGYGAPNYFCYAIEMDTDGDQQQCVIINAVEAGVGFDSKTFCKPFVDFITTNSPYEVTFDDAETPTSVRLTSQADANIWFMLKIRN